MRQVNDIVLSGSSSVSVVNGSQLDANQMINVSFHLTLSNNLAAGVFKLQASNDVYQVGMQPGTTNFTVTNWADIPTQTVTITAGTTQALLTVTNAPYRWMRAVYTGGTLVVGTAIVKRFGQGI